MRASARLHFCGAAPRTRRISHRVLQASRTQRLIRRVALARRPRKLKPPASPSLTAGIAPGDSEEFKTAARRAASGESSSQREFELVDTLNPGRLSRLRNLLILGDKRDPVAPEAVAYGQENRFNFRLRPKRTPKPMDIQEVHSIECASHESSASTGYSTCFYGFQGSDGSAPRSSGLATSLLAYPSYLD